jgi:hypothetical protein
MSWAFDTSDYSRHRVLVGKATRPLNCAPTHLVGLFSPTRMRWTQVISAARGRWPTLMFGIVPTSSPVLRSPQLGNQREGCRWSNPARFSKAAMGTTPGEGSYRSMQVILQKISHPDVKTLEQVLCPIGLATQFEFQAQVFSLNPCAYCAGIFVLS